MTTSFDTLVAHAHGHVGRRGQGRMRRVVVRVDSATLARVDALVPRWPRTTRAGLMRACVAMGVAAAEAYVPAGAVPCHHPVLDKQKRARMCPAAGTTVRAVEGQRLTFCDAHAAEIDAKNGGT